MFGRSGQMFPRRTFHDAIYEEEYGSDNEDECCRCRGLSAILCWFLSVIILVGLAATVVLTVFFILRSRTMMPKPNTDLDVEMYGKDQNLFEANAGGGSSKELLGSNESPGSITEDGSIGGGGSKRKKINTKQNGRGPPDATKNDVDADVNEDQNTIAGSSDEDQAEDASVSHPRNQHPNHHTHTHNNNGRLNRLTPYNPVKTTTSTTTTTTTTEVPVETSDEENADNESSSEEEIETEPNNGEGSSLFNLFSGPRNPSYSTPSQHNEEDEADDDENAQGVISAEASAEYKSTHYHDGSPVQQVLFTESPKVTLTTPSPYNTRRNLQTTRFPMGRTSFSTTSTTELPSPQEESEEDEGEGDDDTENQNDDDVEDHNEEENHEEDADTVNHDNADESSREEENEDDHHHHHHHHMSHDEENHDNEQGDKSSEEEAKLEASSSSVPPTTTSMYDRQSDEKEMGEMGSESGESQLKQMLLDSIPPHGENKDQDLENEESASNSNEPEGGTSGSAEFNLSQNILPTTTTTTSTTSTSKPTTTAKTVKPKSRQDTLSRLISRNFARKPSSTTETNGNVRETSTGNPTGTTLGPAGHKYDYTMTPIERTKLKIKSTESTEQEHAVTRPPPKFRYRSTTTKPIATPGPPSTSSPRTRGTTTTSSAEYSLKMGSKRGSVESPIDIVPSPDLSKGIEQIKSQPNSLEGVDLNSASSEDQSKTSSEQQFLDVLVGSEDHKSLVTKKTDDGVVTSAILPPWYDPNGANSSISDVLTTNGTLLSNAVAKVEDEFSGEHSPFGKKSMEKKTSSEEKNNSKTNSKEEGGSEFDRLVSMFSKQDDASEEQVPPTQSRFGLKKINKPALKKPGGSLGAKYIPQVPGRASLFPSSSSKESSKQGESNENKVPSPSSASPEAEAASNADNSATGDIGRTGILPTAADVEAAIAASGYYPEGNGESGKHEDQHHTEENEHLQSEETEDSNEQDEPSHVIDVNFDDVNANNPAEIIIEQDSSLPAEDEENDFADGDDEDYAENSPALTMSGSAPNQEILPPPEDYVRGSGIRKPVSSEEEEQDMVESASNSERVNVTTTTTTTTTTTPTPQVHSTLSPVAAIRRPAYTREEILKSAVKPSPETVAPSSNSVFNGNDVEQGGSMETNGSGEYEEYEDDNYEGGSVEQEGDQSLERWSSEKSGHRWSAPDQIRNTEKVNRQQFLDDKHEEENSERSAETVVHPSISPRPNDIIEMEKPVVSVTHITTNDTSGSFKAPPMVNFHDNKLNFAVPSSNTEQYHSKDGWRPVISGSSPNSQNEDPPAADAEGFFSGGASASIEPDSSQVGSYEPEVDEPEPHPQIPLKQQQQQLFQEQLPPHSPSQAFNELPSPPPKQQVYKEPISPPPPQQHHQWAQPETPVSQQIHPSQHDNKMKPMIPPPVPAIVKFPDSEEDHEDRHHHGRDRLRRPIKFDRTNYMARPVPPPIVMRRHPQNVGGFVPAPGSKRPGPPQSQPRPQMVPQASQQNPQYSEHPPPPPNKQGRPHGPINRNFHMRPNPMRRFNFGGPPQAQPRSGGNIKWPTEDDEREKSGKPRDNSRSEVNTNNKRRRRRRRVVGA